MTVVRPKINVNAADQSPLGETTINQSEPGGQISRQAQSAGKLTTTCLQDLTYRSSIPHGSSLHRIEVFFFLRNNSRDTETRYGRGKAQIEGFLISIDIYHVYESFWFCPSLNLARNSSFSLRRQNRNGHGA